MRRDERAFERAAAEAGKRCLEATKPIVVNHFDADGLAAGSIACRSLRAAGIEFAQATLTRSDSIGKWGAFKEIIVCDLGGLEEGLVKAFPKAEVLAFDHHPPHTPLDKLPENLTHVNPHFYGIDGASECSAATTTYLGLREKQNIELAIAGSVGDTQDFGPGGSLFGTNRIPVREGEKAGVVKTEDSLKIGGAAWKPLDKLLAEAIVPAIPGMLGDQKAAGKFLWAHDFDRRRVYASLPKAKKAELNALLLRRVGDCGATLVGEVYFLTKEKDALLSNATEYASALNACGRQDEAKAAIKMCLGDRAALSKARGIVARHGELLAKELALAKQNAFDMRRFVLVDGRGKIREASVGSVAGAFLASGLSGGKPVLSMASAPGQTKISVRARKGTKEDFGKILAKTSAAVGGSGGGHAVAAGASIPKGREKKFLRLFAAFRA